MKLDWFCYLWDLILLIPIFTTHILQKWSTEPNFLMDPIHVLYCFILLSMAQAHSTYLGKLKECGLEGMGRFLSDLLHEPSPCVLPSGQGTFVSPLAHEGGLVPKISTLKEALCSGWLRSNFFALPFFGLKHIAYPKWLTLSVATTKCRLEGPTMSKKHQPMNLCQVHFPNYAKSKPTFYPIKANLTITSLILTLWFKTSSIDQKPVT